MRSIELLADSDPFGGDGGGFTVMNTELEANITPSPLALNLYYRTHSTGKTPIDFWGDRLIPLSVADAEAKIQANLDDTLSPIFESYNI